MYHRLLQSVVLQIHYGEYSLDDMPMEVYFLSRVLAEIDQDLTDRQAEEGIQRLADFVDNLPLWHLRGFTAADYPSEALSQRYRLRSRWVLC